MRILAHRGFWKNETEKNRLSAFRRALEGGFGIETDVRDCMGTLVISHDMPRGGEMPLAEFLAECLRHPAARPIAINIKADGMQRELKELVAASGLSDYFVFDMAVPDALGYLKQGFPVFTRVSELEQYPGAFAAEAAGVWLDAFESEWYSNELLKRLIDGRKPVCVVSPELHRRQHMPLWLRLREGGAAESAQLSLCTDFPDEAREFLGA